MLTWSRGVLMLICLVLLAGACTGGSSGSEGNVEAGAGTAIEEFEATDPDLAGLIEAGEVDGVVRMHPPSGRAVPMGLGPTGAFNTRPILSLTTPDGPVDMYEMRVEDPEMGPGQQRCLVIVENNGSGASCQGASDPPTTDVGLTGAQGSDNRALYELVGPADMTHFIITLDGQQLAVVPREGHALLAVGREVCVRPPDVVSAWRGEEELVVTANLVC